MKAKFYFLILFFSWVQLSELRSQSFQGVLNLGDEGNNYGYSIKHDDLGNFYVTGEFDGTTLFDDEVIESHGDSDAYLAKFNSVGKLLWIKTAGGTSSDHAYSISVSPDNESVCISGFMSNASFGDTVVTESPYFIANYDSSGEFNWVRTITCNGGSAPKVAHGISGSIYLVGPTTNIRKFGNTSNYINSNYYIISYDASGSIKWIKTAIGDSFISPTGIAVDKFENIYVFGGFQNGSINFGDSVLVPTTSVDAFLIKYDSTGTLLWSKMFSCEGVVSSSSISVDNMNNLYLVGYFENEMIFDDNSIKSVGDKDAYILKYNSDGKLLWTRTVGGEEFDVINDCTTDSLNNLYITGKSSESASFNELISKNEGIFVAKYDSFGNILFLKNNVIANSFWGSTSRSISVNKSSEIFIAGNFRGPIKFDNINLINEIGQNIFIAKLSQTSLISRIDAFPEDIYYGIDSNFVGSNIVNISLPMPNTSLGQVISLEWIFNDKVIGEGNSLSFEFPVGTNDLILKTISNWGAVEYDTTEVSVYSSAYSREITNYEFKSNNKITHLSNIDNGEFVLSNFNIDLYSLKTVVIDSIFNLSWVSDISTPYLTPCLINYENILYTTVNGFSLLYGNSLPSSYKLKEFSYANDKIEISPSFSTDSLLITVTQSGIIRAQHLTNIHNDLWNYKCSDSISSNIVINEEGDIFFATSNGDFNSLNSDGELRWKFSVNDNIESTPALCLDKSIVFGSNNSYLYKISNEGDEIWNYKADGSIKNSPVIDHFGNIYFGSKDGYFYALNSNGELNWKLKTSGEHEISASIGNNGLIYVNAENNIMYAFDKAGKIKWNFKFDSREVIDENFNHIREKLLFEPLITDNGLVFLRTNLDQYFILKDTYKTEITSSYLPQWPTFMGSNRRTGTSLPDIITTKVDENQLKIDNYKLNQNYPNPFNPKTSIGYSLPQSGLVRLKVYDMLGREVASLVNKEQAAGNYTIEFNATKLSSGVFFYSLQINDYTEIKKLILLK